MTRSYSLGKRAEKQAETRRRIVEAAVELHAITGPAATTVSQIAERAGVQRHTFYAHFPDERSLHLACSGLVLERDPPPEAATWQAIEPPRERLRTGLRALYDWYGRNADIAACVLRDAEHHALTREMFELRFGPPMAAIREALEKGLSPEQLPLLRLALAFPTWRSLSRESGLSSEKAAEAMTRAVLCKAET